MVLDISINSPLPVGEFNNGFGHAVSFMYSSLQKLGHRVTMDNPYAKIQLHWQQPHNARPVPGKYNILYFPWESTELRARWLDICNGKDINEVWTTSDWCEQIFHNVGIEKPIYVYKHGLDHRWAPKKRIVENRPVKFLVVDCEANRKGWQEAFDSFIAVYGGQKNKATLTLKSRGACMVRWHDERRRVHRPDEYNNVSTMLGTLPLDMMRHLYYDHDVMLNLSCLSADTEILTRDGWRGVDDVQIGDIVASVNDNHELEYVLATNKYDYLFSGEMINVNNTSHDIRVTGNHKMIVQDQYGKIHKEDASLMAKRKAKFKIPTVPALKTSEVISAINKQDLNLNVYSKGKFFADTIDGGDLFELVGWFISEGSIFYDPKNNYKPSYVSIAQNKDVNSEKFDRIFKLIERLGLRPINNQDKDIRFYSLEAAELLGRCGRYFKNKKIPKYFLHHENKNNLRRLYEGLMLGDGTGLRSKENLHHRSYYTSSVHLRNDFQELCFKLGYRTTFVGRSTPEELKYVKKWNRFIDQTEINWMISICEEKNSGTVRKEHMSSDTVDNERVWCISNKNSSIVTKRNGKISIMGNCGEGFGFIPFQMIATGAPAMVIKEWADYRDYLGETGLDSTYGKSKWPVEHPGDVLFPDLKQAKHLIQDITENYEDYSSEAMKNAIQLHKDYDWVKVTHEAFEALEERLK